MKRLLLYLISLSVIDFIPLGCGESHRNDLGDVISRYGQPEESQVYYSPQGDVTYLVVWYWTKGKGFKFKEETYLSMSGLSCESESYWRKIEEYTFTPVPSKEEKEQIKRKFLGGERK
ncbi:MAG: hypothetical protein C0179_04885 [Fervidicoccus sp.]|nr:MAG: hypothetical protein C0179_04885 [Fervidicoccus sp.]